MDEILAVVAGQRRGDRDQARVLADVQILEAAEDDREFGGFGHVWANV